MPPKAKFTKEEIIDAALSIARKKGIEAVTAREIASVLGSSARPIFTVFSNMEEVHTEVRNAAMRMFEEYTDKAADYTPIFKAIGIQMIKFAIEEPKLFSLLFMRENNEVRSVDDYMNNLGDIADMCIDTIQQDYKITEEEAQILFRQTWIFTFGICVLCVSGTCRFSDEEITEMLGREFISMIMLIKENKLDLCNIKPKKNSDQ